LSGVLFFYDLLNMEQSVAIRLIEGGVHKSLPQHWADLGAGSGVFTNALATLLAEGSTIYAVDQNGAALDQIKTNANQASIVKVKKNFITDVLGVPLLNGILMANSLHYVKAKDEFVVKLKKILKLEGQLIIVEYDTLSSNQWVPYPIDFVSLTKLMKAAGFSSVEKLAEHPSQFRQGNIYSALVL
jgi:ubiquinone/menaquinone biosynthesis C-methylase UbiE